VLKTVIVYERPEALEVKLITKFLDEFIISLFLAEAIKIQIILCQRLLFCKQFAVYAFVMYNKFIYIVARNESKRRTTS
jgi:hypothetical protein